MSKKRGLSHEEKRTRMLEYFFEKKDFYQLKELEKSLPKEKGITPMSVKDVLTSLVDDCMVDTEKIGTSVYFWAFPSKASQNRKRKINELEGQLEDVRQKRQLTEQQINKSSIGREVSDDRDACLAQLASMQQERQALLTDIQKYRECDPEVMQTMKDETVTAHEAVNRWTDNIFSTKSWAKNKFGFASDVLDKQFGIPEDFDYLD